MKQIDLDNISIEELGAYISHELEKHDIDCTLVGGMCVTIYSNQKYLSYDLDFVTYESIKEISKALDQVGFKRKGKYFVHPNCKFYIDFVSPPVAVGNEYLTKFHQIPTKFGILNLISPTDCVKDRLAAFFHWNDRESFLQALMVAHEQKINLDEVEQWAIGEDSVEKFRIFVSELSKLKGK